MAGRKRKASDAGEAASPAKKAKENEPSSTGAENKIVPYLSISDKKCLESQEFYVKALGATKVPGCNAALDAEGLVMHTMLIINGHEVYFSDVMGPKGGPGPALGPGYGDGITIHLNVTDADEWFNRAVAGGCKIEFPIEDTFWNARYGIVSDPYGYKWSFMHNLPPKADAAAAGAAADA